MLQLMCGLEKVTENIGVASNKGDSSVEIRSAIVQNDATWYKVSLSALGHVVSFDFAAQ